MKGDLKMENIEKRISTRNYLEAEMSDAEQEAVKQILDQEYKNLFGHVMDIELVDQKFMRKNKVKRVGTYGVVTGRPNYIFAGIENDNHAYIDYGYVIERIVLDLTAKDFQTCWMGGTFSRKTLFKLYKLPNKVTIPAVVTVGKKSEKKSFVQNLMGSNYHNRKPFESIFYDKQLNSPLKPEAAGVFKEPLEALRLAPSAVNGQPWRVILEDNKLHFYCESNVMIPMKYVDMGIGFSHFDYMREKKEIEGNWEVLEKSNLKNLKYIISFIAS